MSEPVPQRIGDTERDKAVEYLREHLAQGRLDQAEFDERLGTALTARTAADLEPLFSDLPAPKPGAPAAAPTWPAYPAAAPAAEVAPAPAPAAVPAPSDGVAKGLAVAASIAWPVWLLAMFALGGWGHLWWTVFIPIAISSMAGQRLGHQRHRDRRRGIER